MDIDAIGVVNPNTTTLPNNASVSQDAFIRILLTQLQFQDPLKPVDNQQFIAQLAQFSSLELNRQTTEKIDTLLQMNSVGQALGLIGERVEVGGGFGGSGVGEVFAVRFEQGEPRISVRTSGGSVIEARLSQISLVQEGN